MSYLGCPKGRSGNLCSTRVRLIYGLNSVHPLEIEKVSGYQRHRSKGGFITPSMCQGWEVWNTCAQTVWSNIQNFSSDLTPGSFETMDDNVVAGFYARRRKGEIFFNDMQQTRRDNLITVAGNGFHQKKNTSVSCSGVPRFREYRQEGVLFARYVYGAVGVDGLLPADYALSSTDIVSLQQEVSTKVLAKRGQSDSNLFESIAELRQTLNLFRRPFNSLNRLLSLASGARQRGVAAAEVWLQYRYGVMPVVRDLENIISGVQKKIGKVRKKTSATASLTRAVSSTIVRDNGLGGIGHIGKQISDKVDVKAISLDEYNMDRLAAIGFTAKGLITLPWELIPYSFVIDWFVNVGDFINSLVPLPGVKPLGSCLITERDAMTNWVLLSHTADTGYSIVRPMSGTLRSGIWSKTRASLVQPSLVLKSDFKLTEAFRAADALSLLTQRMDRIFR